MYIFSYREMVTYILTSLERAQDEEIQKILFAWDSLLEAYGSLDKTYKAYGIESLRNVYVSAYEKVDKQSLNPIMRIFSQRLMWLFKLKVTTRINENGELEIMYYQLQDDKIQE